MAACYVQSMVVCAVCAVCAVIIINMTLARIKCKLPDDGRRPKHVGAVSI